MKKVLLSIALILPISANADIINLEAFADHNVCEFNKPCVVSGSQDIGIINNTDASHLFNYTYTICVDDTNCNSIGNSIRVNAHSTWSNQHFSVMHVSFDRYNRHVVVSSVHVRGAQLADKEQKNEIILN